MSLPNKGPLPQAALAWLQAQGRIDLVTYLKNIDTLLAGLVGGTAPTLVNAANDLAAKQQGVAVGQFYRNGSQLNVRVT